MIFQLQHYVLQYQNLKVLAKNDALSIHCCGEAGFEKVDMQ